jgi:undecaprenyl diphosphate synthase
MQNIPKHIVLFPDGNRRWAKQNGLPSFDGHQKGYENIISFAEWCNNKGVKVLTAFGFSTENWKRTPEEVEYLMRLVDKGLSESLPRFQKEGLRVKIIGQKKRLPEFVQKTVQKVEEETANNTALHLNLAVSYGGRWDIVNAAKELLKEGIDPETLTEDMFASHLSTAGLPDPDLIIRAGGEMRLSNFVLWQGAYSELYFSPKFWPDFTEADLQEALEEFDHRQRRYGK